MADKDNMPCTACGGSGLLHPATSTRNTDPKNWPCPICGGTGALRDCGYGV